MATELIDGSENAGNISVAAFRSALEYFLFNFTAGDQAVYRDAIRELVSEPFKDDDHYHQQGLFETEDGSILGVKFNGYQQQGVLKLHLDHLRMPHWLPGSQIRRDGMEQTNWDDPEDSELRHWCESLYGCFQHLPLKYLPVTEIVVRDIHVLLQYLLRSGNGTSDDMGAASDMSILGPSNVNGGTGTDQPPSVQRLLNEVFSRGVDKVLNDISWARTYRQVLFPFQIQLVSRDRPTSIRHLKSSQIERLVVIPGIVIQASKPYLKAMTLTIQCKDCGLRKTLKIPMWKQGVALPRSCEGNGATNSGFNGSDGTGGSAKCSLDPFIIISEACHFTDIQTIKIHELPNDVPTGDIPRHMLLNLPSTLVNRAVPGARIIVCGVYAAFDRGSGGNQQSSSTTVDKSVRSGYIHALGLEIMTRELVQGCLNNSASFGNAASGATTALAVSQSMVMSTGAGFSTTEAEHFRQLAARPDIVDLITASIAPSIHGSADIKRSVACMLFGGSRKFLTDGSSLRGDIHLLLLGDPSTAKSQILKFVERVAPVAIYTSGKGSSAAGLTAALVRDNNGNYALEGGAMVLADGGIVCIDEFDKMRDDDRVAIHEAMEQQTISIAKAGINTVLTTQCGVLAAANPTFGCYDDTKEASEQHNFEATILSRFDCIWLVRDEKNEEKDRQIAKHVMTLYSSGHNAEGAHSGEGPIPSATLKGYIAYCRANCHPRLSAEAAKRLENFYVEVREKCRTSGRSKRDQIPITVRQLESLVRLAESFAKMVMAPWATLEHVEEAIRLFKVSTVATGQSVVHQQTINPEEIDVIKRIEEALLQRLAIGARAAKTTIIRDLRLRHFEPRLVAKAISILVQKGVLEGRGDAVVQRVGVGH